MGEQRPAMHIIRRADGDEMGEFAFFATDGPTGWDVAENADHDEDTTYEILACYPVARRKFLSSTLCATCDGDGCEACGQTGEQGEPDAELLPAPASPQRPQADGLASELRGLACVLRLDGVYRKGAEFAEEAADELDRLRRWKAPAEFRPDPPPATSPEPDQHEPDARARG